MVFLITEEMVETSEVINQLLHHVGAMCIHQLNLLAASSSSLPLGPFLGKLQPMEARHFMSICDIMEKAMANSDTCIIRCILVVFQVLELFCLLKNYETVICYPVQSALLENDVIPS